MEVGVPDAAGRAEILQVLLRGLPHAMSGDVDANAEKTPGEGGGSGGGGGARRKTPNDQEQGGIKGLAARTHGFVGADLQLLVKEAALQALRRTRGGGGGGWGNFSESAGGDDGGDPNSANSPAGDESTGTRISKKKGGGGGWTGKELPTLTPADFRAALPLVSPSGLREVAVEVPSVKWGDIGGMEGVKQSLREVGLQLAGSERWMACVRNGPGCLFRCAGVRDIVRAHGVATVVDLVSLRGGTRGRHEATC